MLRNKVFRIAALACCTGVATGQLSGDYTIDPNGSGPRNYSSFAAAAGALAGNGVSGSARFTAVATTFREFVTFGDPGGAVTIRGSGLRQTVIDGQFRLNLAKGLVLQNLVFIRDSGLFGSGTDIEIDAVRMQGDIRLGGDGYDIHHCSLEDCTVRLAGSDIDFHHNVCRVTSRNSPAISVSAQPPSYVDRVRIRNNLITGTGSAIHFGLAVRGDGVDIWHNTVAVVLPSSGFAISFGTTQSPRWASVYNNIIQVEGVGGGISVLSYGNLEIESNLYDIQSGVIGSVQGVSYSQMRDWQRALSKRAMNQGYDRFSLIANPVFSGPNRFDLHPRSPAINRAVVAPPSNNGGTPLHTDLTDLERGDMRDLGAYELTGHRFFGAGCAGTGGRAPFLEVQGDLGPGKLARFLLTGARPGAPAVFAIGLQQTSLPLGGTCTLLTAPLIVLPVPVSPLGETSVQINMPLNQTLGGPAGYTQFGVLDPAAAGVGIAVSRGVSVHL